MITLCRHDPATNCSRFWQVEIGPDLFGTWCVTRSWGRTGTAGRRQILTCPDPAGARVIATRLAAAKRRRGYREG